MAGGARQSKTGLLDRLKSWRQHHGFTARDSLLRLLKSPMSSLMTWLVIGIALALPVGLSVALENARGVSMGWDSPAQISLFLRSEVSLEAAGLLRDRIAGRPEVSSAVLDMEWVQRLNALVALSQRAVSALGIILALGVLLIIGNTIRLAIENRRQEILVVKLVGGSDAFVRRPFLYTGFWYGLGGAALAWAVIAAALWWLRGPLATLAVLYQSDFVLEGLGLSGGAVLLAAGALLGLLGAWLAVARHLSAIQPR